MENAIDAALATWGDPAVSLGDLIQAIEMKGERNIDRRAGAYLRTLGYEKERQANGRNVWIKP